MSLQSRHSERVSQKSPRRKKLNKEEKKVRLARAMLLKHDVSSNMAGIIPANFLLKVLVLKEIWPFFVHFQVGVQQEHT